MVDFGAIISRSFTLAWRYKSLWVFGLFASSATSSFNLDSEDFANFAPDSANWVPIDINEGVVAALVLWGIFLFLLWCICYLIAMPALIDAINKITRGGSYRFGESFSRGLDFFLRFLGLNILVFVMAVAMAVPVVVGAVITPYSLIILVPLLLVAAFFLFHTYALGEVAMVARDTSIFDALSEGLELTKRNIVNCLLMTLISIGIAIAFAVVFLIVGMALYLPLNIFLASVFENIVVAVLLGILLALPVTLVIGGYTGTLFNAMYIQFYFALYEPVTGADLGTARPQSEGP